MNEIESIKSAQPTRNANIRFNNPPADLLSEIIDLSPVPTAVFDVNGYCRLANNAFCVILGYGQEQLENNEVTFFELFKQPQRAKIFIAEIKEQRVIKDKMEILRDNEKRGVSVSLNGQLIKIEDSIGFVFHIKDTHPIDAPQRTVTTHYGLTTSLIEHISDGMFLVDSQETICEFNATLEKTLSTPKEDFLGKHYKHLFAQLISKASKPDLLQLSLNEAVINIAEHPTIKFDLQGTSPSHISMTLFPLLPILNETDTPGEWGGILQDQNQEYTQTFSQMELLGNLSNSIRSPLATMKGHTSALLSNHPNWGKEMVADFLSKLDKGMDELVGQVDRILRLSQIESGHPQFQFAAVDPQKMLQNVLERAALILDQVSIESDLSQSLPNIWVDTSQIEDVLTNILEYTSRLNPRKKPITIKAFPDNEWVTFTITNHSGVIADDDHSRIFDINTPTDGTAGKDVFELDLNRKLVEAHSGQLSLIHPLPAQEEGLEFIIKLPQISKSMQGNEMVDLDLHLITGKDSLQARILLIEHSPDIQAMIFSILDGQGYQVEIASEGIGALNIIQDTSPDLILLDWEMTGIDGLNLCRYIRRKYKTPIIILTTKKAQKDLTAAFNAGADDFVIKPFLRDDLLLRIQAVLRQGDNWKDRDYINHYDSGNLIIDFESHEAFLMEKRLDLTSTEFSLLAYMARHSNQTLTHGQLIDHLWPSDVKGTRHALFVHINRLRKKIEQDPKNPKFIVTRWGFGYIFLPS